MNSRILQFASILVSLAVSAPGCGVRPSTSPSPSERSGAGETDLVHDIGIVVSGTKVEHVFHARNDWDVPVFVEDDSDIQKSCGCVALTPAKRALAPGESAEIRMQVNTAGKAGPFRLRGAIRWTSSDGRGWPLNFYIEGNARSLLTTRPGIIRFTPDDVVRSATRIVTIETARPIVESTAFVRIDPPDVSLVRAEYLADRVELHLRASPRQDRRTFSTIVQFTAQLAEPFEGVADCGVSVPVEGDQGLSVHASPPVAFAKWSRLQDRATTRVVLHGLDAAHSAAVASIACDGFQTEWAEKEIATQNALHRTLQVTIDLLRTEASQASVQNARTVRIALDGGGAVEIPVFFVPGDQEG